MVANHKGFFAFNLCPNNNPNKAPREDCFAKYPLKFANGEKIFMVERLAEGQEGIFLGERIGKVWVIRNRSGSKIW